MRYNNNYSYKITFFILPIEQKKSLCSLYYANQPEALYAYVNIHIAAFACLPGIDR